jgi:hypothetical protein
MSPTDDQLRALTDYQLRCRADRLFPPGRSIAMTAPVQSKYGP